MEMEDQDEVLEKESWPIDMQEQFNDELSNVQDNAAKSILFLTATTYQKLMNYVKEAKMATKKETLQLLAAE